MDIPKMRKKALIGNFIIMALCVIIIACYFLFPFFEVTLSYTVTAENMEKMIEEELADSDTSEFKEIDFKEILEEDLVIEASVSIKSAQLIGALFSDPTENVQAIIDDNVNNIVDQLDETLNKIAKKAAKQVAKVVLKDSLKSEIRDQYETDKTDAEIDQILNNAGITDGYIETQSNKIVDLVYQEGATTDSVATEITKIVDDVCVKLSMSGDPELADLHLSNEDKAEVHADIKETLEEIAAEDGTLDGDEIISRILLDLLNENESDSATQYSSAKQSNGEICLLAAEQNTEEDIKEELKTKIKEYLSVDEDVAEIVSIGLKVCAIYLLLTIFAWLYLIIKILCKLRSENNAIKVKAPILFGWGPFFLLFLLPTIVVSMFTSPPSFFESMIGVEAAAEISEIFEYFSIDFFSSGIIAFVAAICLFIFAVAFYRRNRRQLQKAIKARDLDEPQTTEPALDTLAPSAPTPLGYITNDDMMGDDIPYYEPLQVIPTNPQNISVNITVPDANVEVKQNNGSDSFVENEEIYE